MKLNEEIILKIKNYYVYRDISNFRMREYGITYFNYTSEFIFF
jgi:hypothetical protein